MDVTAPSSTLFPYTTLFRSWTNIASGVLHGRQAGILPEQRELTDVVAVVLHQEGEHPQRGLGREGQLGSDRSEEHTSELQSLRHLVCRLLLEKKNKMNRAAL